MYKPYGIHKKEWKKMKDLVINYSYGSKDIKEHFSLESKQVWFLFDKLLQGKYNHLYERESMKEEDIKKGQYVYCEELGRGEIVRIYDYNLMAVKFESKELPVMCSQSGHTVYDNKKRKITKL